jgi:hypothetical protein
MTEESPGDNGAPEPAADLPSLPARIAQVFFSPAALFDKLKAKPAWIGALVTLMVVSLIINAIIPEELIRQLVMEQLGDNPEPAQIDAAMRMAGILRYIGPIVLTPILAVILAGLILLIWNLILGGEASFAQTMSVSTHTLFIPTVGGLLTVPLMIASGDATVALSLDLLLPGLDEEGFVYRFLHGLNLFSIWAAVVLGIGVSRLYPKTSAGSAALALVSLYVVFKAVSAAVFG